MAKYQKHSPSFKAKVALEALKEQKTLSELSSEYKVATSQISTWKQTLLESAAQIFESGSQAEQAALDKQMEKERLLYQEIGQLQVALNWLKKKLEP